MIDLAYVLTHTCNHCGLEVRAVSESEPMLDYARRHPPPGWSCILETEMGSDPEHYCPVCTERGKGESRCLTRPRNGNA